MKENPAAKALQASTKIIVWGAIFLIILSLFIEIELNPTITLVIAGLVASFFEGLSEIVELLHKSHKTQEAILAHLKKDPASDSILKDIESNLPKI